MKSVNLPSVVATPISSVESSVERRFHPPARSTILLGAIWLALGVRMALAWFGPKLAGDLTLPGLAFFVITAVLASRVYAYVAKPAPTPTYDDDTARL
jgi:hypothetical protein